MRRIIPFLMCITLLSACGNTTAALAVDTPMATVVPFTPAAASTATLAPATAVPTSVPATDAPTSAPTEAPATEVPTVANTSTPSAEATKQVASQPAEAAQESGAGLAPNAGTTTPMQRFGENDSPTAEASAPLRIVIPAIGLDTRIVSVGLDANRVPIVPDHDVGWYNLSAMPGQGENVVLWGHVLRFRNAPKIPAPFAHVKELKLGALITVYNAQDEAHQYRVIQQVQVKPNQVEYILPQGKELLTMVSCIGTNVVVRGEVVDKSQRLITIAEPVAS